LIVVIISAIKRKVLFAFRLLLLVLIIAILSTQVYGILTTSAPQNPGAVTSTTGDPWGSIIDSLKDYYRANSR